MLSMIACAPHASPSPMSSRPPHAGLLFAEARQKRRKASIRKRAGYLRASDAIYRSISVTSNYAAASRRREQILRRQYGREYQHGPRKTRETRHLMGRWPPMTPTIISPHMKRFLVLIGQ